MCDIRYIYGSSQHCFKADVKMKFLQQSSLKCAVSSGRAGVELPHELQESSWRERSHRDLPDKRFGALCRAQTSSLAPSPRFTRRGRRRVPKWGSPLIPVVSLLEFIILWGFFAFLDSFLCFPLKQLVHQRCSLHPQTKINPNPFNPDPFKLLHPHPLGMQPLNPLSDSPNHHPS